MVHVFLQGLISGLVISILVGPAFFALIQTGITRGFRSGFFLALGISLSDATLIVICYLGAAAFFENNAESLHNLYFGIGGGTLLIAFGAVTFTRKPDAFKRRSPKYVMSTKLPGPFAYLLKGYFMNLANPAIILFWLSLVSWVKTNASDDHMLNDAIFFFSGTLSTIFGMDLLKCFVGNKIKKYMTLRILFWINRIVGMVLAVFGIVLILRSVWNFYDVAINLKNLF